MARWAPLRLWIPPAVLATLTVALGFHAGGFFARSVGVAAVVLALALAARVALARNPLEGMSRPLAIALAAMILFVAWTLASAGWSDAGFRSLIQADRALLYAVALAFFGTWARSEEGVSATLRGALLACVVVCAAGLIHRLLPDVWALGVEQRVRGRLQYPLTYANSMGLLAALGLVWSFGLTASTRESRVTRVLAAAAVPVTAATLVLTLSRGAIGGAVVGFVALGVLGRSRAMLNGALATIVPGAATVFAVYRSDALTSLDFTSAAATGQGHRAALVLVIAAAGAMLLRAALLTRDDRPPAARMPAAIRRALVAATAASVLAVVALTIALDVPGKLNMRHDRFTQPQFAAQAAVRDRLTDPGSTERVNAWRVALQDFREAPLRGRGAGTFPLSWNERRPLYVAFNETHSLYLQMLGELGLVGLALLAVALLTILVVLRLARRGRGAAPVRGRGRRFHHVGACGGRRLALADARHDVVAVRAGGHGAGGPWAIGSGDEAHAAMARPPGPRRRDPRRGRAARARRAVGALAVARGLGLSAQGLPQGRVHRPRRTVLRQCQPSALRAAGLLRGVAGRRLAGRQPGAAGDPARPRQLAPALRDGVRRGGQWARSEPGRAGGVAAEPARAAGDRGCRPLSRQRPGGLAPPGLPHPDRVRVRILSDARKMRTDLDRAGVSGPAA